MMSSRSSLHRACLLVMDANMWRDLETVSLFTYDVGTFPRCTCQVFQFNTVLAARAGIVIFVIISSL